jgi:L-iditol 2-dehydrogenase
MIGLGLVQACKAYGIPKVIVSEPSKGRREMATKVGADVVIDPSKVDAVSAVIEATGGWKANVVFECSGSPVAFTQAPRMLKFLGTVMQVGFFEQGIEMSRELISEIVVWHNLTIRGCGGQKWDMATELMRQGKIKTKDMITYRYSLDDVKEAFETQLRSNDVIKVMLEV